MKALVVGLGVIGRATSLALIERGFQVQGFDALNKTHTMGSSHGESRIIRTAYFEHPDYVPLAKRSFQLWRELELQTGASLLEDAPCLTVGKPGSSVVAGVLEAARIHGLSVEQLDRGEAKRRYPWLKVDQDWTCALEKEAGVLHADRCRKALLDRALELGGQLEFESPVEDWGETALGVWVKSQGKRFEADLLVLCPGPWAGSLLGDLGGSLRVMRQVVGWTKWVDLEMRGEGKPSFPVFFFDTPEGYYYGMRAEDWNGVKVARHYGAPELETVEGMGLDPNQDDAAVLEAFVRQRVPGLADLKSNPLIQRMEVCRYTLTPDRHFLLGKLAEGPSRVIVAGGMSGHGFKFAPALGELVADLALGGRSAKVPELFSPRRLQ